MREILGNLQERSGIPSEIGPAPGREP